MNWLTADYQPCTLIAPKSGTWLFNWYNYNPKTSTLERVRKTFDINRIRSIPERKRIAKLHLQILNKYLAKGYNYFIHTLGYQDNRNEILQHVSTVGTTQQATTVLKALEIIVQSRTAGKKKRTQESYNSTFNVFAQWLKDNNLHTLPVADFKPLQFQQYINHRIAEGNGNRNINDHTGFIKKCFDIGIKKFELLQVNPLASFEKLPEQESTRFEAITADELQQIASCLYAAHPNYYLYTKFTSHEFIRPYHTQQLQAKDIDYTNDTIRLRNTKNNKIHTKQLMPDVKKLLVQLNLHRLPGEYYLFGKNFKPSKKEYPSLSKRSAELWRELIKNGLGINKEMYALKHTAGQYYVNENSSIDAAWLQRQMEHSNLAVTEKYIGKRGMKKIDTKKVKLLKY